MVDFTKTKEQPYSKNMALELAHLALFHDKHLTGKYGEINDAIKTLHETIQSILNPLKSTLIQIKTDDPNGTEFDLSKHWDLIEAFQDNYNKILTEIGEDPKAEFGMKEYEQSKKVSRGNLEKLLQEVSNAVDDKKFELQQQNQSIVTHSHLALNLYEALHRTLVLVLQGQQRIAQETRPR